MAATTPGLVCAHHHLYSTLARGMPAPPKVAANFQEILEQVWWRLDAALDLEMIRWSAMLGALEALENGTTAIVDHHESPNAIEGSLDGEEWQELGRRKEPFSKWTLEFSPTSVRYVRVKALKRTFLHLESLEVR